MHLNVIAVGQRMPAWVSAACGEYQKRLPRQLAFGFTEIAPGGRRGADAARAVAEEGDRMLRQVPPGALACALDERGAAWTTREFAGRLAGWMQEGRDVALLVGGPDGLAPACRERAELTWSLSPLTLPHALVRVLLAEQVYRAWTLLQGHPYHRD